MCEQHRFSLIEAPSTQIYGTLFIVFAIIACLANLLALYILCSPRDITKSNKILISLAISDMLTGAIGFPISAYEILSAEKDSCDFDTFRAFVSLVLTGSSNLTLSLISFDRYLLMTKYTKYNSLMSGRRLIFLIIFCWIYPSVTPALKYVESTYPYLASLVFIFYGPIIFIIVFYFLLVREIYRSEKQLRIHGRRHIISNRRISNMPASTTKDPRCKRSDKRHLKTARAVSVLLGCYCICMAPFNIWLIFSIANSHYQFMSLKSLQHWYIIGITVAGWNSCINPFVYLSRQPDAKKRLKQLMNRKGFAVKTDFQIESKV